MASVKILGIDPGTANYGWCIVDSETLAKIDDGVVRLPVDAKLRGGDAKLSAGVASVLAPLVDRVQVVISEQQMRRKMDIVCAASLGYALGRGKKILSVAPATAKRKLGIRPGKSHAINKALALQKCKELGVDFVSDHAADAYICARYAALILKEESMHTNVRQPSLPDRSGQPSCGDVLLLFKGGMRVPRTEGEAKGKGASTE